MAVRQLGYVRVEASSLDDWEGFLSDLLEGANVIREGGELLLQLDSMFARVIFSEGGLDDITAQGWEVASQPELERLFEDAKARGLDPAWASDEELVAAKLLGMFAVDDPSGLRNEIFYGAMYDDALTLDRRLAGRFLAGPLGGGHTALFVDPAPYEDCIVFYRDLLGMVLSGQRVCDPSEAFPIAMFRCNARQHSVGLVPMDSPTGKRLAHFSVEYTELDPVGRSYDYAIQNDSVKATLGRHQSDNTVSFYTDTPSGFEVEVGWDSRLVPEDAGAEQFRPKRLPSIWGHRR